MLAVAALVVSLMALFAPRAEAAPLPTSSTSATMPAGSYIIDMGRASQTRDTLESYGLIYALIVRHFVPVEWVINTEKPTDGVDFTYNSTNYRSSAFIIRPEYVTPDVLSTINAFRTDGVKVDGPTASAFDVPVFETLNNWPKSIINNDNEDISENFYALAGIPREAETPTGATFETWSEKAPSALNACDDLFVMPHSQPTLSTHSNLLNFNEQGGAIWAGCHAVSYLENLNGMNFLTTDGLRSKDATRDQLGDARTTDGGDPANQYLGTTEDAHDNGSQQIYVPSNGSSWRPTTNVIQWDPNNNQAPNNPGPPGNRAATVVWGPGFGDPTNGLVMYEGGHDIGEGTSPDEVAAVRVLMNFHLMVGIERGIDVDLTSPASVVAGATTTLTADVSGGTVSGGSVTATEGYQYEWISSCGGTFSPSASGSSMTGDVSVSFTAPSTAGDCQVRLAVVDDCNRQAFDVVNIPVTPPTPSYTLSKVASVSEVLPGGTVQYTVTVTNTGNVAYTSGSSASFTDDLSNVLDDATLVGSLPSGASLSGSTLSWSGALAVGQTVEVTYSVTVNDPLTGDQELINAVVPTGTGGVCESPGGCVTETPVRAYSVSKVPSASEALPGDVVEYTVSVTNIGQVAYAAGSLASFTDDLSSVLDDATLTGPLPSGATLSDSTLSWSGELAVGETVEVTYSVTVNDPISGDQQLVNAVVPSGPGGSCEDPADCVTETPVQAYSVSKVASSSVVEPGDVVTYTVSVENIGQVAYTDGSPASFEDDLSSVLDDATYNDDASNGASVSDSTLSWSGALAVGQTITVTYSVTVNAPATGDRELTNAVIPTDPGGSCEDPADCVTETPVRTFTVLKTADVSTVIPGETVTYTVEVTNTGQADFTSGSPASFTDDLSEVLDDATYNDDATGGASVSDETLSWSGELAVGQTVEVTYSVTVNDPVTGDQTMTNVVVTSITGNCPPGSTDAACTTVSNSGSYSVSKVASVSEVLPGGVVEYTVEVTNTGDVDYTSGSPASFTDDLSSVLDDATYNDDATGGASVSDETLSWSGALAVGETVEVTYSVTVNDPISGDQQLVNAVVPSGPGGSCEDPADCVTETPVQAYSVSKVASSSVVEPGDVVTYTVSVENIGQVAYTDGSPASFEDDLSSVLDDATYNDDASNGASVSDSTLSWSGALAVGQTITVTYSVTVNAPATGDRELTNAVIPTDPGGSCEDPADCVTETPVRTFTVLKTADVSTVIPGETVTYTVEVTNTGQADFTSGSPASFTDDLSEVLDDATYNDDATGGASVSDETLSWSGELAVGQTVEVTYSVTVNDPVTGDQTMTNVVVTSITGNCPPGSTDAACTTVSNSGSYSVSKVASVSEVLPGGVVEYTVEVTNTGDVDYTTEVPASFTDNLSSVLDDATYNDDASNGASVSDETLSWSGALAVGETVTVTYSVTVNDVNSLGDERLVNAVVPTVPGGTCESVEDCETVTPVMYFETLKTVSEPMVSLGSALTYTITITNTSQVDFTASAPAQFVDNMSAVLDDAIYMDDADHGAVYSEPELSWSGPLAVGESLTITYTVLVNDVRTGDLDMVNVVVTPVEGGCPVPVEGFSSTAFTASDVTDLAEEMPEGCVAVSATSEPLAFTGASAAAVPLVASGVGAVLLGLFLMLRRRRATV